jgi:hypothetical protein
MCLSIADNVFELALLNTPHILQVFNCCRCVNLCFNHAACQCQRVPRVFCRCRTVAFVHNFQSRYDASRCIAVLQRSARAGQIGI